MNLAINLIFFFFFIYKEHFYKKMNFKNSKSLRKYLKNLDPQISELQFSKMFIFPIAL